ncbi:29651_t:CDS:1, partial [Racocetra persica]
QPINQVIGGLTLAPQNANIPVNASFDNLKQKYEILTKGVVDLFTEAQEAENQTVQSPDDIISGLRF